MIIQWVWVEMKIDYSIESPTYTLSSHFTTGVQYNAHITECCQYFKLFFKLCLDWKCI